jgi:glycosyltransferase involved in cell wall biosynthesis
MPTVQRPLISIVTPSFNAGGTIRDTMESILPQLADDVEHLLIDAGSTDNTLEIARLYPHLSVISERDRGIYDGMNKGAALAKGDWILFLQADDWLPDESLEIYRMAISENPRASVICGSAEAVKEHQGNWLTVWTVKEISRKALSVANIALDEPMINARLVKKDIFDALGGFSLKYTLASDRDFLLRAAEAGINQCTVDALTYRYRWHPGSSTMTEGNRLTKKLFQENLAIAKSHHTKATGSSRKALCQWLDRLMVQSGMNAIEEFRWRELLEIFREGSAQNPLWSILLAKEALRSFPGFVARGGKTRTQVLNRKD